MNSTRKKSGIGEYVSSILIAIGLALLIRTGVVQAFYIPSGSMEDTLLVGDYLLANKFVYGAPIDVPLTNISLFRLPAIRDPEPGDIVIFRSPVDEDRDLIKRCVAIGGQEIRIVNKVLYINGEPFRDPPLAKYVDRTFYPALANPRDNFGPYTVPADHFFMMGDNRDNSLDSRALGYVGFIPFDNLVGKAEIIFFSIDKKDYGIKNFLKWRIRFDRIGKIINKEVNKYEN